MGLGLGLALLSAATFGTSGIFGRSLIDAGWSARGRSRGPRRDRRSAAGSAGGTCVAGAVARGPPLPGHDRVVRAPRGCRRAGRLLQRRPLSPGRRGAPAGVLGDRSGRAVDVGGARAAPPAADGRRRRGRGARTCPGPGSDRGRAHRPDRRAVGSGRRGRAGHLLRAVRPGGRRTAVGRPRLRRYGLRSRSADRAERGRPVATARHFRRGRLRRSPDELAGADRRAVAGGRGHLVRRRNRRGADPGGTVVLVRRADRGARRSRCWACTPSATSRAARSRRSRTCRRWPASRTTPWRSGPGRWPCPSRVRWCPAWPRARPASRDPCAWRGRPVRRTSGTSR